MKIALLGVGSWGTALGKVLFENQQNVLVWGREQSLVDEINNQHTNKRYLPGIELPESFKAMTSLEDAVVGAEIIVLVVPSKAIREVTERIKPLIQESDIKPVIVHAAKGLERETSLRMSQVIADVLPREIYDAIVVLSGPSHAEEVARKDVTTIAAASESLIAAKKVQDIFMNSYFRVYTNSDVIGVELGGALKNIIAVCAGMLSGLNYGDNSKAALITRGLAEISRLGVKLGADPLTFSGLSGVGDLIVTCTSVHSRNWQAGNLLSQGLDKDEVEEKVGMVVEGFNTTQVAHKMANNEGIEMPLTAMLHRLLFEDQDLSVEEGISILMGREGKQEASLYEEQGES